MSISWDHLRLILMIVDHGGITGAALNMGVHHATVLRRLDTFEHQMGLILFERHKTGYQPTELGEALAQRARKIAVEIDDTYRKMAGEDLRLSGTVRVATSDYLAQEFLPDVLRLYKSRHAMVEIELTISSGLMSLTKREADVAFRVVACKHESLTGTKIMSLPHGVFAHSDVVNSSSELSKQAWVVDDHALSRSPVNMWWESEFAGAPVSLRANSTMAKFSAIKKGLGIGFLPVHLARSEPSLICVDSQPRWNLDIWLLAHADLYSMPRIRALEKAALDVFSDLRGRRAKGGGE